MLLASLLLVPLLGIFLISALSAPRIEPLHIISAPNNTDIYFSNVGKPNGKTLKKIALSISILNLIVSLVIYMLFDFSSNQFQFVQEHYNLSFFDVYLGVDGISIYFVLLTTIIMPIAIISN